MKKAEKNRMTARVKKGISTYVDSHAHILVQMITVFGKYKMLVVAGFFMQPLLAVGQLFFGFSFIYTFGYLFVYNGLLLTYAQKQKKLKNENPEGGSE